jgi:nucleotide-binding universal stress UspA family protein/uncharacterized membrane protein (DUF485 family)
VVSSLNFGRKNGGTILLATDGSKPALMATKKAIELAKMTGATVHSVCIREESPLTVLEKMGEEVAEREFRGIHAKGNEVTVLYGRMNGVNVVPKMIEDGPIVGSILKYAREIKPDFIVMGNSGRSGWERISLGSVAEGVMRRSEFPVIMTKGWDDAYLEDILKVAQDLLFPPLDEELEREIPLVPYESLEIGKKFGLSIGTLLAFLVPYFGLGMMTSFAEDLAVQEVGWGLNVALVWIFLLFPMGWITAMVFNKIAARYDGGEE